MKRTVTWTACFLMLTVGVAIGYAADTTMANTPTTLALYEK